MTKTLSTTLTDEQQQTIGLNAEENFMTDTGWGTLRSVGVELKQMLTPDDQETIMFWAGCLGDYRIAMEMFGAEEPTEEMPAARFTSNLHSALRKLGKEALRREVKEKTAGAKVVSFTNRNGGRLVIHPAVRADAESPWQLTTIGYDGRPWGHTNPPTFEEALYRSINASEDGYWNESGYSYEWSDNVGGKPPI